MPNFKIVMKSTQKGIDEIDKVADRRGYAIALMQADFPAVGGVHQIVFRNSTNQTPAAADIEYHPTDKTAHVVWHLTAANKDLVVQLANAFKFHGRVNTLVRPDP
jgi:hypothetical protein